VQWRRALQLLPSYTAGKNSILDAMKAAIDAAGRLVIPKEIRRQAGLQPGMLLDLRWHDGRIEIEPAPASVVLIREGRFVHAGLQVAEGPVLSAQEVKETRDAVAREHERER
jgi:AbrB family looped-hinge helix DNA binding protein